MNNPKSKPLQHVAEQVANNSTGWIGQVPGAGNDEHITKGQTFLATGEGDLEVIQIFSNLVTGKGHLQMTVHHFDPQTQTWGNVLAAATEEIKYEDAGHWISFHLHGPHLNKGDHYGFQLDSTDSFVGIGEVCATYPNNSLKTGQEWQFSSNKPGGYPFSYFSLAFKVQVAS